MRGSGPRRGPVLIGPLARPSCARGPAGDLCAAGARYEPRGAHGGGITPSRDAGLAAGRRELEANPPVIRGPATDQVPVEQLGEAGGDEPRVQLLTEQRDDGRSRHPEPAVVPAQQLEHDPCPSGEAGGVAHAACTALSGP